MPRKRLKLPLVSVEFSCVNYDGILAVTKQPKLFCSDKCQQEAKFVRYFRNCKSNGRINQPDIREALQMKLAHILGGGYKASERRISLSVRRAVYKRDKRTCQKCGKPGRDIDHINGSSNEIENLQVLCRDCHNEKTKSNFKELTPEVDGYNEKKATISSLRSRTESETPQRICDDEKNWNENQKIILAEMRQVLYNERFLESGRNEGIDVSELEKKLTRAKNFRIDKIIGLLK